MALRAPALEFRALQIAGDMQAQARLCLPWKRGQRVRNLSQKRRAGQTQDTPLAKVNQVGRQRNNEEAASRVTVP